MAVQGKAPFPVEGVTLPCETWYTIFGDIQDTSKTPLFILHGGPTAGHEYLLSLHDLADVVIFYDQLGCGQFSPVSEKTSDEGFWTPELFCAELSNLINHLCLAHRPVDVLGHSWGGGLASQWASDPSRARNLRRLILCDCSASMQVHIRGLEKVRQRLPRESQEALERGLQRKEYDGADFTAAMRLFCERHMSLSRPFPCDEIAPALTRMASSKLFKTMWGPHTLVPSGGLRDRSSIPSAHKIRVPTLMLRGSEDYILESTMQPFFDNIPKVKWYTVNGAAHFPYIEQRQDFYNQVQHFLEN